MCLTGKGPIVYIVLYIMLERWGADSLFESRFIILCRLVISVKFILIKFYLKLGHENFFFSSICDVIPFFYNAGVITPNWTDHD